MPSIRTRTLEDPLIRFHVWITKSQLEWLRELARENQATVSSTFRAFLDHLREEYSVERVDGGQNSTSQAKPESLEHVKFATPPAPTPNEPRETPAEPEQRPFESRPAPKPRITPVDDDFLGIEGIFDEPEEPEQHTNNEDETHDHDDVP